jgi:hypothetical protein
MTYREDLSSALTLIFEGIGKLQAVAARSRRFTIDGRLVGDIGEFIASMEYDVALDTTSQPGYDGVTSDAGECK